jgi:hypothetical protein
MNKQHIWTAAFTAAQAEGFGTVMAGALADVRAREWESAQYFAAAERAVKEAAAYHALSVRDNAIDRKWAAKLSAA